MKKILIPMFILFLVNAKAHIEFEDNYSEPTQEEITKSRSCFEELTQNGCGDPGDDLKHFRSCLHHVFPSLSRDCQNMMTHLYSRRK